MSEDGTAIAGSLNLGRHHLKRGYNALMHRNAQVATEQFLDAATLFAGPAHLLGLGHCWRGLIQVALEASDYPEARRGLRAARNAYRLARLLVERIDENNLGKDFLGEVDEGEATCLVMAADLNLRQGHHKQAHEALEEAYPLYQNLGERPSSADLWMVTARLAEHEGRWFAAQGAWKRAVAVQVTHGADGARVHALVRLAEVHLRVSAIEKAEACLEEAGALATELEDDRANGQVLAARARVAAQHGQLEAAWELFQDALNYLQKAGSHSSNLEAIVRVRMARVATQIRPNDAIEELRQAALIFDDLNHPTGSGLVFLELARLALRRGKPDLGLLAGEASRRVFEARNDDEACWAVLSRVAMSVEPKLAFFIAELRLNRNPEAEALAAAREALLERAEPEWVDEIRYMSSQEVENEAIEQLAQYVQEHSQRAGLVSTPLFCLRNLLAMAAKLSGGDAAMVVAVGAKVEQPKIPILRWEAADGDDHYHRIDEGALTFGRSSECDVRVGWDKEVSRHHCTLVREGQEIRLQDGQSLQGTWIGFERVESARTLKDREEFRIGASRFKLTWETRVE